jgi:hypothetical protein
VNILVSEQTVLELKSIDVKFFQVTGLLSRI